MVRLTDTLCKYIPEWYHLNKSGSGYFRKQYLLHLTRFHKNIAWSTVKNSNNRFHYLLKGENYFRKLKSQHKRDYNRMRISAACEEHGYQYKYLQPTLLKTDINLNLASLATLSIYEPRTFKSLVDICRHVTDEKLPPANFSSRML